MHRILVVNPGSTSTKIALYHDEEPLFTENINHSSQTLAPYRKIADQYDMRRDVVLKVLSLHDIKLSTLSAVVGRGGLLPPVKAGAYEVNRKMVDALRYHPRLEHASNLGGIIAYEIASPLYIPAYIYDPVTVDEMEPIAKIAGLSEMRRESLGHNLNMRATSIRYAKQQGKELSHMNLITAHLGGGITISLFREGRMVDIVSDDEGPFSPERSGGLPMFQLIEMATSGKYDYKSLMKKVKSQGGLISYFGTSNAREVEQMIDAGDEKAALVYEAMAYNIAKNIGKLAAAAQGRVDAIILTGGLAYSKMLTQWIAKRVNFIAPVKIMPGENEMEALAFGALRVLRGEETAHTFS
jgi:butyrate kinase